MTASSRSSGARSASASSVGLVEVPRRGDRRQHLLLEALDEAGVGLAVGVGVALLREHVRRGLVLAARDELRLNPRLVQRIPQEQRVGGEPDQPDRARRLHPHLAERRRQVVRHGARVGLGPGQGRLVHAELDDGGAQLLHGPRRRGGHLHAGDQCGHPVVLGGPPDGGDGFAQQQRLAPAEDRERVEPAGLLRHRLQVDFEDAPAGDAVVPGGVDLADDRAQLAGTRHVGEEAQHDASLPTARAAPRRVHSAEAGARSVKACASPSHSPSST